MVKRSAAQRATSRLNGQTGGRPKAHGSGALQRLRRECRKIGEQGAARALKLIIATADGLMRDATVADRIRASENLLDRFGYPRLAQTQQQVDFPAKLIDMTDWKAPEATEAIAPPAAEPNGHDMDAPTAH